MNAREEAATTVDEVLVLSKDKSLFGKGGEGQTILGVFWRAESL